MALHQIHCFTVFERREWITSSRQLFLACKSGSKVHPFMSVSAKCLKFTNSLLSWSSIIIAIYHRALDPDLVKERLAASLQSIVYFSQYDLGAALFHVFSSLLRHPD